VRGYLDVYYETDAALLADADVRSGVRTPHDPRLSLCH
jgi:hypothetical protein